MSELFEQLYHLPAMQMAEAPSSWLCRAAFSQGATWKEFLAHMRVTSRGDLDLAALGWLLLATEVEVPAVLFESRGALRILLSLKIVDPTGERFLLRSSSGTALFRFCPRCLAEQSEHYLPIEWRFRAWLECPIHQCMMLEGCTACGYPVSLPVRFRSAGRDGIEVPSLGHCQQCGRPLWDPTYGTETALDETRHDAWKAMWIANGRATVAALYFGTVHFSGAKGPLPLKHLRRLDRMGLIPNQAMFSQRRPERGGPRIGAGCLPD